MLAVVNRCDLNPPKNLIDHLESGQYKGVRVERGDGSDDLHSLALGASHSERIPLDKRLEKVLERDSLNPEYSAHCINLRIYYSDKGKLDGALRDVVQLATLYPDRVEIDGFMYLIHEEGGPRRFQSVLTAVVPTLKPEERTALLDSLRRFGQEYSPYVSQVENLK